MKLKYLSAMFLAMSLAFTTSCHESDDYVAASGDVVTSITTGEAIFTAVSADITGTVTGLEQLSVSSYEVGVVYSTTNDPTSGTKVKGTLDGNTIKATLTGLTPGTTYYYMTYVLLQGRVYRYGDLKSFVATDANIATAGIINLTPTTASIQGQYRGSDGIAGASLGIVISSSEDGQSDAIAYYAATEDIGKAQYTTVTNNLLPSTTYYATAFMELDGLTEWGEPVAFTTPDQTMEYVDLGLSVLWAAANLGGENPQDAGTQLTFSMANGILSEINIDADGNNISALPTKKQVAELIAKTTQSEETVDGVDGVRFTAANGNSIFLPYAIYWTGEGVATNSSYAHTLNASSKPAKAGTSERTLSFGVRTVAEEVVREGIRIRRSKIVQGDLEGNGNYRVELYNAYGATAADPAINPDDVLFETNMQLKFTITGLPEGTQAKAHYSFADGDWDPSNWEYNDSGEASVLVNGNGTYTMLLHGAGQGTNVFCIDFDGLAAAVGADNINVDVETIIMDVVEEPGVVRVKNEKLVLGDIEGNGNYRIELYNEYGASKADPAVNPADIKFDHNMQLTFTISGIPEGKQYKAYYAFADGDWNPSNWAYNDNGEASALITGNGTYTLTLHGAGEGAMVFCVDIAGLSADAGADNISVTVDKLVMDHAGTSPKTNAGGYLNVGDLENNGRIRIEIYNEYGSTKEHSIINPADIVFSENMAVTFNISGITGNLKDGAATMHVAGLEYSDPTWGVSYWSELKMGKYEAPVTGDGTYTVWCEVGSKANGAIVFCIDIDGLGADLVDASKIAASIVDIKLDATMDQKIFPQYNTFQNKDGNGTDGRIEIYNEYGNGAGAGVYNDNLAFNGMCLVQFTIQGINGNLAAGAAGSYKAEMSYAAASWDPSYWGGNSYGSANVTGDGTYEVFAYLNGDCLGAVVWTIELYNLWKDLVDTSKVKVSIDKIITPRKL